MLITTMTLFRLCLASSFLLSMASALDMLVKANSMICDNRLVKASLSYVCSDNSLCTLGKTQAVKGSFIYEGLQDYYNATNEDYFTMDAKINLGIGGITAFSHTLVDNAKVPVCNQFTANDYNVYGDCPADGRYAYSTKYNFPAPGSDFMSWASTGYEGDISLDIYFKSSLVGRCVLEAKTMMTGTYESKKMKSIPSGMVGAIVALSILALVGMFLVCRCIKSCRKKQSDEMKRFVDESIGRDEEPSTDYNRMEAGGADDHVNPTISVISKTESRYSADGPVI